MESTSTRMSIVTALVRSSFLVEAVYARSAREHGLTPQQGRLLCVLMARPYGMGELGQVLGLAKSSLTGLVDRTERNGYVQRSADPQDQRAVRVELTGDGARLARTFFDATCREVDELAAELDPEQQEQLAGLLERVVEGNEVPAIFSDPDDE